MMVRVAGCLLAVVSGLTPPCAFARTAGPPSQVVPAARIAGLAARIARSLVTDPNRALAPSYLVVDQSVPAGVLDVVSGAPQVNSSFVSVPIVIDIDGSPVRTVFTGFRITDFVRMPVAAHDLAPGAVLEADDLAYARLPFNGRRGLDIETFIGRKVRETIARGDVVYPERTTVNEIVRAGMPVLLIVHDGAVRLNADVVARNGGGLGDYVTVFNPQTQRALSGIVTGPNTVEVTLPGADS